MNHADGQTSVPFYTTLFGVQRDEFRAVAWSFAYFFCILSSYFILRPVRDALAVDDIQDIRWLFTGTLVAMLIVSPVFAAIASRFPRKQFLPWVYYFFSANIVIFYALFSLPDSGYLNQVWVGRAFFVWLSVFNLFVVTVFWSFMADIFNKNQSRRLFGIISAGGSIGAVLGPAITGLFVTQIGFKNLLPISAVLLLAATFCIFELRSWVREQTTEDDSFESGKALGGSAFDGAKLILTKPFFAAIALMLLLANFVGVVSYQYLGELVGQTFAEKDQRTQVFSVIDLSINALSFIGQLLLVRHSVRKFGVGVTLSLLPIVSAIGFAILAINPIFAVMAVIQVVRRATTFGFTKPSSDMLYAVVTPEEKYKVKNFIDTVVYRSSDAVSAWLIRALGGLGSSGIALLCIPVSILWATLTLWIGRRYRRLGNIGTTTETTNA